MIINILAFIGGLTILVFFWFLLDFWPFNVWDNEEDEKEITADEMDRIKKIYEASK